MIPKESEDIEIPPTPGTESPESDADETETQDEDTNSDVPEREDIQTDFPHRQSASQKTRKWICKHSRAQKFCL